VVDMVLLAGKVLLLALIYLFLFSAVRTGIGVIRNAAPSAAGAPSFLIRIERGPRELKGLKIPVAGPVRIGRSPDSDVVISDDYISSAHARIVPSGENIVIEDLGSTNGTMVNGRRITAPVNLSPGDEIDIGAVRMKVDRR